MRPGLARAVPMGIIGFIVGATLAYVIRLAQGLEPNAAAPYGYVGPAMVLGAFISSFFFIWGMGAFDPRMSVHGEEHPAEAAPAEAAAAEKPASLLGGFTWQILFWLTILIVGVAVFAFVPFGPTLHSVRGDGNPAEISWTTLGQLYSPVAQFAKDAAGVSLPALTDTVASIQLSYLLIFVLFVLWSFISLFVVAGFLAYLFTYLASGARNPQATNLPWRLIILALLLLGLTQFPILAPTMILPMLFIAPVFILPLVALAIVYRNVPLILLGLLVIPLLLLILVPALNLGLIWLVYNLVIVLILEALALRAVKSLVSERLWLTISSVVYDVTLAAALVLTVVTVQPDYSNFIGVLVIFLALAVVLPLIFKLVTPAHNWPSVVNLVYALALLVALLFALTAAQPAFWQIAFFVIVEILVALLLIPTPVLRNLIPGSLWERFAAVRWANLIPDLARSAANWLEHGLPRFLGER